MENIRKGSNTNLEEGYSEYMLSDLELGLFEKEICSKKETLELIKFNKLDMILELNNKLIAS